MALSLTERAVETLRGLSSGDVDKAIAHVRTEGFLLHDPSVSRGVAGLRELAARSTGGGDALEVARTIEDGAAVVIHARSGDAVVFAVFRFEKALVAELWWFTAPAAPSNRSGHSQTDGPVRPDPGVDTAAARMLVRAYYETVHIAGRHEQIDRFMSGDRQIRHEPGVRDGVDAFRTDLAVLTRDRTIDDMVLLAAQGDFVFIAARGTHAGEPCAYIDLYRVEANQLVEHWGFPQAIPSQEMARNPESFL